MYYLCNMKQNKNTMKKENYLKKLIESLKEMSNLIQSDKISDAGTVLDKIEYDIFVRDYEKLMTGFFWEKDIVIKMLEYFMDKNESFRIKNILIMLNKYYPGSVEELMNSYIEDENYESCQILKDNS